MLENNKRKLLLTTISIFGPICILNVLEIYRYFFQKFYPVRISSIKGTSLIHNLKIMYRKTLQFCKARPDLIPFPHKILIPVYNPDMILRQKKKVEYLAGLRKERNLHYNIEIDGGVNRKNLGEIVSLGVDIVVAGTAVFQGDISENMKMVKEVMADAS